MTFTQVFLKAANLRTLYMGCASVLAGTAAAAVRGNLEVLPGVLCLVFGIFAQLTSNISHFYFRERFEYHEHLSDFFESAKERRTYMPMLVEAMRASAIMAGMAGLVILSISGWWTIIVALIIILMFVIFNIGHHPLSRTSLSIIGTFLMFGPICVIGTSLVQSARSTEHLLNWYDIAPAVYMSIFIGFMAVNEQLLYDYRAFIDDRRHNRGTMTVRHGREKTRTLFFINGVLFFAVGIGSIFVEDYDYAHYYVILPTLSFIVNCYVAYKMKNKDKVELLRLQRICNITIVLFALLSLILLIILGSPNEGVYTIF